VCIIDSSLPFCAMSHFHDAHTKLAFLFAVLGAALRAVSAARVNYVRQCQGRIVEPLPPTQSDLFETLSTLVRARGQMPSLIDAVAQMLGYDAPPAPVPGQAPNTSNQESKPKVESVARRPKTEDGDADDSSGPIDRKVAPMEIVSMVSSSSSEEEDKKPAAVPSSTGNGDFASLKDDSDDESLPEAVVFQMEDTKPALVRSGTIPDAFVAVKDDSDDESLPDPVVFTQRD